MPCYSPNALGRNALGETRFISGHHIRQSFLFNPNIGLTSGTNKGIAYNIHAHKFHATEIFPIACKSCIGCRLHHSREWAIRCTHENQMHEDSSFLTLTYSDEYLPKNNSLILEDMQKFFKRLRDRFKGIKIRYMYCGEYGDTTNRPHYHVLLFGLDFHDKQLHKILNGGHRLYVSDTLHKIWAKGWAYIGSVTFESAAYVARYIDKKVNGPAKESHYAITDKITGEVIDHLKPEYAIASRMKERKDSLGGGLGTSFFEMYHEDIYPSDEVVIKGKKMRPPTYYDKLLERQNPDLFQEIKEKRKNTLEQLSNDEENSMKRLLTKEKVKLAQISKLIRPLD